MQIEQLKQLLYEENHVSIRARAAALSYFKFIQEFWNEIVNDPPIWNWHIPLFCLEIEKIIRKVGERQKKEHDLVVNIPPGMTKSLTFTVLLPAWAWTNWPWMAFIKTSYSAPLSLEHAEMTRDVVRSKKYQTYYPHLRIRRDKDMKSNFKIGYFDTNTEEWKTGGNLYSTSVEGTVTGFHGHVLLTDDPIDPFKSHSPTQLESCNRWLLQTYSNRKKEKSITPQITVMQRVARKDPSAVLLGLRKKGKKIRHICLPAVLRTQGDRDRVSPQYLLKFYDERGGFLDPSRLNEETLLEMELVMGQFGFKAQMQQNPTLAGKGMFDVTKLNMIKEVDFNKNKIVKLIRYWDKAGTQDAGKRTAGVLMAKMQDGNFVVVNVIKGQWGTTKRENIIEEIAETDAMLYPSIQIAIEQEPGSGGKESAENTKKRLEKAGHKVIIDNPTGDKIYRADPYSVAVGRGMVSLIIADWNEDYKEEMDEFPDWEFKDQIDGSSGAYGLISKRKKAGTW